MEKLIEMSEDLLSLQIWWPIIRLKLILIVYEIAFLSKGIEILLLLQNGNNWETVFKQYIPKQH